MPLRANPAQAAPIALESESASGPPPEYWVHRAALSKANVISLLWNVPMLPLSAGVRQA